MINAEQVQDRGVEVVHVNRVLGCGIAQLVGLTVFETTLGTATRHPDGESLFVVVAANLDVVAGTIAALGHRGPPEFR